MDNNYWNIRKNVKKLNWTLISWGIFEPTLLTIAGAMDIGKAIVDGVRGYSSDENGNVIVKYEKIKES